MQKQTSKRLSKAKHSTQTLIEETLYLRWVTRVLLSSKNIQLVGDAHRTRKLTSRFIGPYPIKRIINSNAYELDLPSNLRIHPIINVSQLKPYREGTVEFPFRPLPNDRPEPEAYDSFGQPEFIVERVVDKRIVRGGSVEYLVLWQGYPEEEASWEPKAKPQISTRRHQGLSNNQNKKLHANANKPDHANNDSSARPQSFYSLSVVSGTETILNGEGCNRTVPVTQLSIHHYSHTTTTTPNYLPATHTHIHTPILFFPSLPLFHLFLRVLSRPPLSSGSGPSPRIDLAVSSEQLCPLPSLALSLSRFSPSLSLPVPSGIEYSIHFSRQSIIPLPSHPVPVPLPPLPPFNGATLIIHGPCYSIVLA